MTSATPGQMQPIRHLDAQSLHRKYRQVRSTTERLCEPLAVEDYVVQTMDDVSPTKWHVAHTTWFFETFVLERSDPKHRPFHPRFRYLFNSYYNAVGEQYPRPRRGLLSRPTVEQVFEYRHNVDGRIAAILDALDAPALVLLELGLHHEQQHQELLLTDVKHVLATNPLRPAYRGELPLAGAAARPMTWCRFDEGMQEIGHVGEPFCFDNEGPRHRVFVEAFELADRPVTNGEYLAFIEDGGYENPELWLSEGWVFRQEPEHRRPLYWEKRDGAWWSMTLAGMRPVDPAEPVCHVSYYEADAYARWAGARLPTETEWEVAARDASHEGTFLDGGRMHPAAAVGGRMFGDVWEWTQSPYAPYPGYRPPPGAVGEYNGKFMCNQMVLRGGSCVTPAGHVRPTYRNFFYPASRWQFTGLRLAREVR